MVLNIEDHFQADFLSMHFIKTKRLHLKNQNEAIYNVFIIFMMMPIFSIEDCTSSDAGERESNNKIIENNYVHQKANNLASLE